MIYKPNNLQAEDLFQQLLSPISENISSWKDNLTGSIFNSVEDRKVYICRYFPAYFAEYYSAIEDSFKRFSQPEFRILSIGCGAVVDYCAFRFYELKRKTPNILKIYHGIDIYNWLQDIDLEVKDNSFKFEQGDISEKESSFFKNFNTFVFGKSLGDLSSPVIDYIAAALSTSNLKEIYFLISFVSSEATNGAHGTDQFKIIAEKLKDAGYLRDEKSNNLSEWTHMKIRDQGIRKIFPWWVYPNNVSDILKNELDVWPMLTAKRLNYALYRYYKE